MFYCSWINNYCLVCSYRAFRVDFHYGVLESGCSVSFLYDGHLESVLLRASWITLSLAYHIKELRNVLIFRSFLRLH